MNLQHAQHNEEICRHIMDLTGFNDWVLTTAFYSALHYIQHRLFPLNVAGGNTFANLEAYRDFQGNREERHRTLIYLSKTYCPSDIGKHYQSLYDVCKNARYHDYQISDKKAIWAISLLEDIKSHCESKPE